MPVPASASLRAVIRQFHLTADRQLGQHFLLDPAILARIARASAAGANDRVLEVGPGPGGLTRALLATRCRDVVAIEQDTRCVEALYDLVLRHAGRLLLVQADARQLPLARLDSQGSVTIVANLPFNIGTELLLSWFGELASVTKMVLMFQREVALRLTAAPGSSAWSRLGVLAQALCTVEPIFDLSPAAFHPAPKVASSVVRLTPRADRPHDPLLSSLQTVTRAAFGQRRKMLRSALRTLDTDADQLLAAAGIAGTRRAETLSLDEFLAIARAALALSATWPRPGEAR